MSVWPKANGSFCVALTILSVSSLASLSITHAVFVLALTYLVAVL